MPDTAIRDGKPDSPTAVAPTVRAVDPRGVTSRGELAHMDHLAQLADTFAAAWKDALATVPGGRMRSRVRAWAEAYKLDALGIRNADAADDQAG